MRRLVATGLLLAALGILALRAQHPATAVPPGVLLGPDTWQQAQELLPEEILAHYRSGDYANTVMAAAASDLLPLSMPPDFMAASRANAGRYALGADGGLVEAATGGAPAFVTGLPFPDVDASDPAAGAKIVWNYFYAEWYRGNSHFLTELLMLSREGIERRLTTDVSTRVYQSAPEARGRPNPLDLVQQTIAIVVAPADLNGTISLTWRHRSAKHDDVWAYVPGLRRVRKVNPLNRSDGFLGSDISLDDGPFFDGKPEDFTFVLRERRQQLVLADPFSLRGEAEVAAVAGGGWRSIWKDVPRIGADDPAWKGAPWAPVSAVLIERPVWVVEARPRDPNYLYGRLVLRFDAENYHGTWASKYDRGGALLASYQVSQGAFYQQPDGSWMPAGGVAVQTAENLLYDRATVVVFPLRSRTNPADYRVPLRDDLFSPDALVRLGR